MQIKKNSKPLLLAAAERLKQSIFCKSTAEELQAYGEQVLNDTCFRIQSDIGTETGDNAASYFSGKNSEVLQAYIASEIKDRREAMCETSTDFLSELVYLFSNDGCDLAGYPFNVALDVLQSNGYTYRSDNEGHLLLTDEGRELYRLQRSDLSSDNPLEDFARIEAHHLAALNCHNALTPDVGLQTYFVGSQAYGDEPIYETISRFGPHLSQIVSKRFIPKMTRAEVKYLSSLGDKLSHETTSSQTETGVLNETQAIYALNLAQEKRWVRFTGTAVDAFKSFVSPVFKDIEAELYPAQKNQIETQMGTTPDVILDF